MIEAMVHLDPHVATLTMMIALLHAISLAATLAMAMIVSLVAKLHAAITTPKLLLAKAVAKRVVETRRARTRPRIHLLMSAPRPKTNAARVR